MLGERVLQVLRWYLQRFRRYRKKTRGGLEIAPPPVGRGLTNPTSFNNKLDELYTNIIKFSSDVVCTSEGWQLEDDKARIPGFNLFQRPRLQRRGGGVGCYVKQSIPVKLLGHLNPVEEDVEIMWLHIRPKYLPAGPSNICIASVYFPPGARANLREEHKTPARVM